MNVYAGSLCSQKRKTIPSKATDALNFCRRISQKCIFAAFLSPRGVCLGLCSCARVCINVYPPSRWFQKSLPSRKAVFAQWVNRSFCARPHDGRLSQNISVFTPESMKFVSPRESLHFGTQGPAINVRVARGSIGCGCGGILKPGGKLHLVPLGYL